MDAVLQREYMVGAGETDLFNQCRPSSLLYFLQDIATEHADILGVDRAYLQQHYGAAWLLARMRYTLERPISGFTPLTLRTWFRLTKGAIFYRDFEIEQQGEILGKAVSAWVVVTLENGRMLRPGNIDLVSKMPGQVREGWGELAALGVTADDPAGDRLLRYSDLDINGHVNNLRYADMACDALELHRYRPGSVREMQICYHAQCYADERITLTRSKIVPLRFWVKGVGPDDKLRFEAEAALFDQAK